MATPTEVREIQTDRGWEAAIPLLRQLWTDADEAFVRSWREEEDYRLFGLYEPAGDDPDDPVAVAGVSVQRVLHHARHLWIHDFVVDEPRRGEGLGTELLRRVEEWGRARDCESVALGCVADNDAARAFYEANGLAVWGHLLEREL